MKKASIVSFIAVIAASLVLSGSALCQMEAGSSGLSPFIGILKSFSVDVNLTIEGYEGTQQGKVEGDSEFLFGARFDHNLSPNGSIEGRFGISFPEKSKVFP